MDVTEFSLLQQALVMIFWPVIGWTLSLSIAVSIATGIALAVFEVGRLINGES